jgi:hypothetical protein
VRQNVLAFLADLFYILEVRPAKCIRPPGLMRDRFPINEGKKSFGQLSRYVGPFLFLWKKNKKKKQRKTETTARAILLVWYCILLLFSFGVGGNWFFFSVILVFYFFGNLQWIFFFR